VEALPKILLEIVKQKMELEKINHFGSEAVFEAQISRFLPRHSIRGEYIQIEKKLLERFPYFYSSFFYFYSFSSFS